MRIEDIKIGDKVIYIPDHLLIGDHDKMILIENLGIVTSKNDRFVFVRYNGETNSKATNAEQLFSIRNRPDLIEKLKF